MTDKELKKIRDDLDKVIKEKSKPVKRRIESSKKILLFCDILLCCVVLATFTGLFLGFDVTPVVQLDISLSALSAAAHSFYYWKAKAENLRKYNQENKITMNEGDPIVTDNDPGMYG